MPRSELPAPRPLGARDGADRCPGALRLHEAADGWVARVRLPGGRVSAAGMREIASVATEFGDGRVFVTSRGNVQIRGLAADTGQALADRLSSAGLLPCPERERVRNVVASPLAGVDGVGTADVEGVLADLDRLLCEAPGLERLSGRFLIAVDDGHGDVASLRPDLAAIAEAGGTASRAAQCYRLWVDGHRTATTAQPAETAAMLAAAASRFLETADRVHPRAWRIRDLGPDSAAVSPGEAGPDAPAAAPPSPGLHGRAGSRAVHAVLPLGVVSGGQWSRLADVATSSRDAAPLRITPWRGVVVAGLADEDARSALEVLGRSGFAVEPGSPWPHLSACVGRPGCASSRSDVHTDARLAGLAGDDPAYPLHVAGCARGCGQPAAAHLGAVATGPGRYDLTLVTAQGSREPLSTDTTLAAALTAARRGH